jgi:hypothetical protein
MYKVLNALNRLMVSDLMASGNPSNLSINALKEKE